MSRLVRIRSVLACLAVVAAAGLGGEAAAGGPPEFVDVLISFDKQPGPAEEALIRSKGGQVGHTYHYLPTIAARVPVKALNGLSRNRSVMLIEQDVPLQAVDAELDNAWGVARIGSDSVHATGNKGAGVKVAILDSGVDYTHPDLDGVVAGGWDFFNNDSDPMDDHSHGTHIAGTIAAEDDGFGVVGVAPAAEIYALKVMDSGGTAYVSTITAAIEWCIDNGIQVTNNSYGTSVNPGSTFQAAFDMANAAGIVMIASAGNSGAGADTVLYPARYPSVIAVGATNSSETIAWFSSTGPDVEICAPGESIYSTMPGGGYGYKSGTSMAGPHAVGAAALVIAAGVTNNQDVRDLLSLTALDLGDPGWDSYYGNGRVDVAAAVASAVPSPDPTPTPDPEPTPDPTPTPDPEPTPDPAPGPSFAFVDSVVYTAFGGKSSDKHLNVDVNIVDENSQPVAGALVAVQIYRDGKLVESSSALTDDFGTAAFGLRNARSGVYETVVVDVDASPLSWDGATPINAFSK